MNRREAFGRAIREYREAARLTQPQLAERLDDVPGLQQAAISKIERGNHKSPEMHLGPLAEALGIRSDEIIARVEELLAGAATAPSVKPPPPQSPTVVPLVGWVRAGQWDQVENPFDPDATDGLVQTSMKVSRRSYALRVKGDSMTSATGDLSFPAGTTIIVDPAVEPLPGKLVIAQVDDAQEATFKRLVVDGGQQLLVPLNPQYPTLVIDKPVRITGVVVGIAERPIA